MRTIKLFTAATIAAVSISGMTMSAHAVDTPCFEINETFNTRSVMDTLNAEAGLPAEADTSNKNKKLTIEPFDFKKLGSAQKDAPNKLGKLNCNVELQAVATVTNEKKSKDSSPKNAKFVYKYDAGKSTADEICYRFKSQSLRRGSAAKSIIPTDFCVAKQ